MTPSDVKLVIDKIIEQSLGYKNPFSVDDFMQKFAFDVRLPQETTDSTDGSVTWAQSLNPAKFITLDNAREYNENPGWERSPIEVKDVGDVLAVWNDINYTTTERAIDSINFTESDNIYRSENVYRSMDIHDSKNILFCDSVLESEYTAASQRSNILSYSARVEDSKEVSNSFAISWSGKVSNSLFVHDCYDMYETIFCSHLRGKRFCIANMQYEEEEYYRIKDMVVRWILNQ